MLLLLPLLLASAAEDVGQAPVAGSVDTTTVAARVPPNPLLLASNITVVPSGPELLLPLTFRVVAATGTKPRQLRLSVRDLFAPANAAPVTVLSYVSPLETLVVCVHVVHVTRQPRQVLALGSITRILHPRQRSRLTICLPAFRGTVDRTFRTWHLKAA